MRRRTIATLALVAIVATAGAVPQVRDRLACEYEDSPLCVWWGPFQGNGRGAIVVNGPR